MLQSSSLGVPRKVLSYFWKSNPSHVPHMTQRENRVAPVLFVVVFLTIVPFFAFAQIIPTIVPEDCRGADAAQNCGICDLAQLAQNVLNAGIYIAIFLSAVLFAWAGWKYVTAGGNVGKATQAREIFTNVLVGLIIILAGWLVVDTLMKTLVKEDGGFGPWSPVCTPGGGQIGNIQPLI